MAGNLQFKVFKPMTIGLTGAVFLAALLVAGLFVYRPWRPCVSL